MVALFANTTNILFHKTGKSLSADNADLKLTT
jgi:hypothetical protein